MLGENRVATGIDDLDGLIEGGFPKGSLILLAGAPGTGKTSFASRFVCYGGSNAGENPVYVSFNESKEQFTENLMRHFGRSCEECLAKKRCKFLDFTAVKKEGVPLILEEILRAVRDAKAKRLVIDSFSVMTQALEEKIETRTVIHAVLGKIVRKMGCTTIMIMEVPRGTETIGDGVEEFVADGLITMYKGEIDGILMRDMEISKMRGTRFPQHKYITSLEGGFKVFPPFTSKKAKRGGFKPIPEEAEYFSTGNKHLDDLLEGGYHKGSVVLFEPDSKVTFKQMSLLILPTIANFLSQGRGVIVIPPASHDAEYIAKMLIEDYGIPVESIDNLFRGFQFTIGDERSEYVTNLLGKDEDEEVKLMLTSEAELIRRTGKTPLHVIGLETLEATYGAKAIIRQMMLFSTTKKEREELGILVCRPGLKRVKQRAANIADIHLKIMREHGALLMFGRKGIRTPILGLEEDSSAGYPMVKFTPIT